jgi:hypothetical protein
MNFYDGFFLVTCTFVSIIHHFDIVSQGVFYVLYRTRLSRRRMIWLLPPPLPSSHLTSTRFSLSRSSSVSSLLMGMREVGQTIGWRESLVLCNTLNTLCIVLMYSANLLKYSFRARNQFVETTRIRCFCQARKERGLAGCKICRLSCIRYVGEEEIFDPFWLEKACEKNTNFICPSSSMNYVYVSMTTKIPKLRFDRDSSRTREQGRMPLVTRVV